MIKSFFWSLVLLAIPLSILGLIFYSNYLDHQEHLRWVRKMRARDYQWFATEHPDSVSEHGVRCTQCKSSRIHVRSVMNQSYMREHFCARCGTTLYYSEESTL
jgi:predicted SprT family Zn-dependent metalloprotease